MTDAVDISPALRGLREPEYHGDKQINGFDTETHDGNIFILSYSFEGYAPGTVAAEPQDGGLRTVDRKQLWRILTHRQCHSAVNVWYNLDFDVNALIGSIMGQENACELAETNTTQLEIDGITYTVTYVRGKFLKIKDHNNHVYRHYDVSQYFHGSLDASAEAWIGERKQDVDPGLFKQVSYLVSNWNKILDYARRDAELVRNLWREFVDYAEGELNIPCGNPISSGYIAQQDAFNRLDKKPSWGSGAFQKLAYDAYHGGRFEVFKRGSFSDVIGLDINSAYPDKMRELPDLSGCDIHLIDNPELKDIEQADWGVLDVTVSTDSNRKIQPFAVKKNTLQFPVLNRERIHTIKEIFLFALREGYITDYTIHEAGLVYEGPNVNRPFGYMDDLYTRRLNHKELRDKNQEPDKNDKLQYQIKITMNALYGKTIQTTDKTRYPPDAEDYDYQKNENLKESPYSDNLLIVETKAGELFNPFYAAYITGLTRLQLHKKTLELGLENQCIMFATDCLMIEAQDIKNPKSILSPNELGGWDYDYRGSAFVIGAGVYDVQLPDGSYKMTTRGFRDATKKWDSWREAIQEGSNGVLEIDQNRPATFREWLENPNRYNPAGFYDFNRELRAGFDSKRSWEKSNPDFSDLMDGYEDSQPLELTS